MPFIRRNFGPLGGQGAPGSGPETSPGSPQSWSFRTADATTVVDTAGYFNEVRALLEVGDLIYVAQVDGAGALVAAGWHVVRIKTATSIDVVNVTVATITNTD